MTGAEDAGVERMFELASTGRRVELVDIIRCGGDRFARDSRGRTLLHAATDAGDARLWRALAWLGCDPLVPDGSGLSAETVRRRMWAGGTKWEIFLQAVSQGRLDTLRRMLGHLPGMALGRDHIGRSALHHAAECVQREVYDELVCAGCDPFEADDTGSTPWGALALHCELAGREGPPDDIDEMFDSAFARTEAAARRARASTGPFVALSHSSLA